MTVEALPASDIDLFCDDALADPFPLYKILRDLGPAAYLNVDGLWFLGRYQPVRDALRDHETFVSGHGVGLNGVINAWWERALISTDPPEHTALRRIFTDRLGPRQLGGVKATLTQRADELIQQLLHQDTVDAVTDISHALPVQIVMELIGWPEDGREELLTLAAGIFNVIGPENDRMKAAIPQLQRLDNYLHEVATRENLAAGGFGASIYEAVDRGELPPEAAVAFLSGYATAALDTTTNAIGTGIYLFAQHFDQWDIVRQNPTKVPDAFLEILRYDSPVATFSRVTGREVDLGDGVVIPPGARVVHSYASANRDERHYADPDRFDITRRPFDHLAFDLGTHSCAGQGLAKILAHAVFEALAAHVGRIELTDEPVRALNNVTRGFESLPVKLHPSAAA